jgi:hypothetical protein
MKIFKSGLVMLVLLFTAASAFGQSRVVLDQSTNAVAFTKDNTLWGLEINGKEVLKPQYQSVGFSNGLFKVQQADTWNVCGADGKMAFSPWIKAKDVKITDRFILFEEADGAKAVTYDRSTGKAVQATETSYDAMRAEMDKKYKDDPNRIHGVESQGELSYRLYSTYPHYVYDKLSAESSIKISNKYIVNWWRGTGEWLYPDKNYPHWYKFPYLGKPPYREDLTELYFLLNDTKAERSSIIWVDYKEKKYYTKINGKESGYVKITPHPSYTTRIMMCQTEDGVEHPIWVWGRPLIDAIVPNESWNEDKKGLEEIAKPHLNCPHCIEQSKKYNEKKK